MPRKDFDIIIVGSGTCGATLAKELSGCGKSVLVAERGQFFTSKQTGSEFKALKYYDRCGLWSKTKEGVVYYRAIMAGGTSIISCGNGVRSMEKYFKKMGIDLKKEFAETEKELCIKPVPKKFLGPGTRAIMKASSALGFKMFPMPKYINFKKCIACGNCVLGCLSEAKWSALRYLKDAQKRGASVQFELNVSRVLVKNKRAVGIEAVAKNGAKQNIYADTVILAAGGLGTPVILQNSGIKAGQKLFLDLFTVTTGLAKSKGMTGEVVMGAVHLNKGFLLSPFIDVPFAMASVVPVPLRRNLNIMSNHNRMLGIMVKIDDDTVGRVRGADRVEKTVTKSDLAKLDKGTRIAKQILIRAGADPDSIVTTKIRGAHPGGTAAIGEVVNKRFETRVKGLFVCDASILPISPGIPPIVTLIALAKKFAKRV